MLPGLLIELVDFDGDLYRNIATLRVSRDLFDDLSDDPRDRAAAAAAESRTQPETGRAVIDRPFDYGFAGFDPHPERHRLETRFGDGTRYGVWYGSLELKTTVYETVHHWTRFLLESFAGQEREIRAERRVCLVRCRGLLVDLREKHREFPGLIDPESYAFTQQVGAYVYDQGQNGLLVRSARCRGDNGAIFARRILSNARDHCYLTYRWRLGEPTVRVERRRGRTWLRVPATSPTDETRP